jgi:hypothetical protein
MAIVGDFYYFCTCFKFPMLRPNLQRLDPMNHPPLDENLIRKAFLQALEGGKRIHRKTLVKLIADAGALEPEGRTADDYKPIDQILGDMMFEGRITQSKALICRLPRQGPNQE